MNIAEKLIRQKQDFDKVYEAGKKDYQGDFWDIYQGNGMAKSYAYSFGGAGWTDDIYNPKYDIIINYTAAYMYAETKITDTKIVIDLANGAGSRSTSYMFNASSLVTIRKLIVSETTQFSNTFRNCKALENITIEGTIGQNGFDVSYSNKLSATSLMSIIKALDDKRKQTETQWVITLGSDNIAKLSDAEKAIATQQKGWTLA